MALTNYNAARSWTLQSVNSAQNGRYHIGAFLPHLAGAVPLGGWRDGVICTTNTNGSSNIPADLQIKAVSPTPSLSLTVEPGHCVITRSGQGPYLSFNGSQGTLTVADASPTNPRIDRIVAQVYDSALGDTLPSTPTLTAPGGLVIRAVTGTPSGSPVAPATPTGAISLATVLVGTNATQITNANITDTRRSAFTPSGARFNLPGDAVGDAGAVSGELRYSFAAGESGPQVWTGTDWQSIGVKPFPAPTNPPNVPANTSSGQSYAVALISIPDPGGPYRIGVSGGMFFEAQSGTGSPISVAIEARVNNLTWSDSDYITKGLEVILSNTNLTHNVIMPYGISSSTYTGANTVYLIFKNLTSGAAITNPADGLVFSAHAIPVL